MGLITENLPMPRPVKFILNWGRRYSLWVMNFGLACCAIEFIAASTSKHDFIRLGVIPFAHGPRQADLLVVAGTLTDKMAPALKRVYDQMREPKSSGRHLVIKDLLITNGHAQFDGGIQASGPLTLLGSTRVSGNTAERYGGGIDAAATVILRDSAKVDNNSGSTGGGIFTYGGVSMSGTAEVNGNTATADYGGGIQATNANLSDDAQVSDNVATGPDTSEGGGLWIRHSLTLAGSAQVSGNQADAGGGVFANRFLKLKDQASVTGNSAVIHGGIFGRYVSACDNTGLDEWTGAISPNTPDDPPSPTPVAC